MGQKVVLKAENILKVYPNGVVANKDVNLEVYEGEIHALIGEKWGRKIHFDEKYSSEWRHRRAEKSI